MTPTRFHSLAVTPALSFLTAALFLTACGNDRVKSAASSFSTTPQDQLVALAWVQHPQDLTFTLNNTSRFSRDFTVTPDATLSPSQTVTVNGGDSLEVHVPFTATAAGTLTASIIVASGEDALELPVSIDVRAVPTCDSTVDCIERSFDFTSGQCTAHASPDGAACGAHNQCLTNGRCMAGECVGTMVTCDDGNACTRDSCSPSVGCMFTDAASECPAPADPCHAAVCDPVRGCGSIEVTDGTSCGPRDCTSASICMAGTCVNRPVPEGAACGDSSPCQSKGTCQHQVCVLQEAQILTHDWTNAPGPTTGPGPMPITSQFFEGQVDAQGNSYAIVNDRLVSYSAVGTPRWQYPTGAAGLGVVDCFAAACASCSAVCQVNPTTWQPPIWLVDEATQTLFISHYPQLSAVNLADGTERWTLTDITAGLPQRQLGGNGVVPVAQFKTHQMTLLRDAVVLDVTEGYTHHFTHIVGFDRGTGVRQFATELPGHVANLASLQFQTLAISTAECAYSTRGTIDSHYQGPPSQVIRLDTNGTRLYSQPMTGALLTVTRDFVGTTLNSSVTLLFNDNTSSPYAIGTYLESNDLESFSNGTRTVLFSHMYEGCGVRASADVALPPTGLWGGDRLMGVPVNGLGTQRAFTEPEFYVNSTQLNGAMLADGSMLFLEPPLYDVLADVSFGSSLTKISPEGKREWSCPMDSSGWTMAVANDRVIVSDGETISSVVVPGLRPATTGWSAKNGNQARDRVAR